jgi:tetratricopeptide (TPR) repeat protein
MIGKRSRCAGAVVLVALALGAMGSPAAAQRQPSRAQVTVSDFWREVQTPGVRRASTLLRHGLRQLTQALRTDDASQREAALGGAVARLRRAHERAPADLDVLYFLAFASSQRQLVQRQPDADAAIREAIGLYEQLRALDEDYEAESVAFELGLLYTRLRQYGRAVDEYERGILRAFDPRSTVSAHANMAEVIMLNGDAALALRHYERAAEIARQYSGDSLSLALALWGSAVASDRLGEGSAAVERAGAALNASGGTMAILRTNGVFFEPESEIHWYEGLGALAMFETASGPGRAPQRPASRAAVLPDLPRRGGDARYVGPRGRGACAPYRRAAGHADGRGTRRPQHASVHHEAACGRAAVSTCRSRALLPHQRCLRRARGVSPLRGA